MVKTYHKKDAAPDVEMSDEEVKSILAEWENGCDIEDIEKN